MTNRWQAAQRGTLPPFDLTHVQFVFIAAITWLRSDGEVTQKQLAEFCGSDPIVMSQVVRVLERRGLVDHFEYPSDGRAKALTVTMAGRELANVAVVAGDEVFFVPVGRQPTGFTRALATLEWSQDSPGPVRGSAQPLSSSKTLAAWPSAFTWYHARAIVPSAATRNVERMTPIIFLPYMVFSPQAPNASPTS